MSNVIKFYKDDLNNGFGFRKEIVEEWSDEDWESSHDFIQWLFPLKTPSNFNPDAPLLTETDIYLFRSDPELQVLLGKSFYRFLRFVGLDLNVTSTKHGETLVVKASNFSEREPIWKYPNHNWLRITRVIASMRMLALGGGWDLGPGREKAIFECLSMLYNEGYGSPESFEYWRKASEGLIE